MSPKIAIILALLGTDPAPEASKVTNSCQVAGCPCGCEYTGVCTCNMTYVDAVKTGKPVLLYFSDVNCIPCKRMQETTLRSVPKDVVFVLAKDSDRAKFGVTAFPTTVVVCCGWQWREVGYIDVPTLLRLIERAKAACRPVATSFVAPIMCTSRG